MAYQVGQKLYFWNIRQKKIDWLVVTAISCDGIGFQFDFHGKLYKCTYERAKGKLYTTPIDVPEYRAQLQIEKSCDVCFYRWSGECTTIKSTVCKDYRAGPVLDYSIHGPTGDSQSYRPIWI